jgi:hypothetical protein
MSMKEINEIRSKVVALRAKLADSTRSLEVACMEHNDIAVGDRILVMWEMGDFIAEVDAWTPGVNGSGRPIATRVPEPGTIHSLGPHIGYIDKWVKV